jgi:predicted aspartyl protease
MGYVYCELTVKGKIKEKRIKALVDTRATYLILNNDTVKELGLVDTGYKVTLTLADKRKVDANLYIAEVKAEGRRGPVMVASIDTPIPLLGIFALESLGLKPDPISGRLEVIGPEGGYLLLTY